MKYVNQTGGGINKTSVYTPPYLKQRPHQAQQVATNQQYELVNKQGQSSSYQGSMQNNAHMARFQYPTAFTTTKYLVNDDFADLLGL